MGAKMQFKIVSTAFAMLFYIGQIWAHSDETLDSQKSPNGGQVRMAGAYHLELVMSKDGKSAKENPIRVYVTDHAGNKVASTSINVNMTLLDGKNKSNIELKADGDNRFKGVADYAFNPKLKAVVSITSKGQQEQARFTPFAAPTSSHGDHKH
jgi:hypothetical protein